jgi:hypothetical protein
MMKGKNRRYGFWFNFDPIVWISSKTTLEIILRILFSTNNIFSNVPSKF